MRNGSSLQKCAVENKKLFFFQFCIMFSSRKCYFALNLTITYGVVLLLLGVNGWVCYVTSFADKLQNIFLFLFQRPFKIIISNHTEETYSPKCRLNASFGNAGKFDLYVEFVNTIRNPFMHTGLYFESDSGKYDLEVLNRTIDLCKFYKNKRYEPILQVIFKLFADTLSHWARRCPMTKVNFLVFTNGFGSLK